jgi:hypothetical protein
VRHDTRDAVTSDLAYPICIEIPQRRAPDKSAETSFPSEFVTQFAIESIPHFVVVNRHRIVAASLANRFQDGWRSPRASPRRRIE